MFSVARCGFCMLLGVDVVCCYVWKLSVARCGCCLLLGVDVWWNGRVHSLLQGRTHIQVDDPLRIPR